MSLRSQLLLCLLFSACTTKVGGIGDDCDPGSCARGLTCVAGACEYVSSSDAAATVDMHSDHDAAMHADAGMQGDGGANPDLAPSCGPCDAPPASMCSGMTLTTYDNGGTCQSGVCTYGSHMTTCQDGCASASCEMNACDTITCNAPPSVCYAAKGTCSKGSCSYGYDDGATCNDNDACTTMDSCDTGVCKGVPMACNTPPASTCKDSSTVQTYAPQGTCSVGACSYTYTYQTCTAGCVNGACKSSGWVSQASSTTAQLNTVWGSSPSAVWTGGVQLLLYYNGVQWEQVASAFGSMPYEVESIHGTSASNVFALAGYYTGEEGLPTSISRYNGTSWSTPVMVDVFDNSSTVFAIGDDDALVVGRTGTASPGADSNKVLYRVQKGVVSLLGTYSDESDILAWNYPLDRMWATSASDIYLPGQYVWHWDGKTFSQLGVATNTQWLWGSGSVLYGASQGVVSSWNGTTWTSLGLSASGTILAMAASASNRAFACGGNDDTGVAFIYAYDGVGWTQAVLPKGTSQLDAIWAFSTGQAVAVGENGTILAGP